MLAARYGFPQVPHLVALKAAGAEHGALAENDGYEPDLERLEGLLAAAHAASPLPEVAANEDALDDFLVHMRRTHFA